MTRITGLKASPYQDFSISSPNGDGTIYFTFYYRPRVRTWFFDIAFNSFIMNGYKLTRGPNILQSYSNIISFGLGVMTTDGSDPFLINDLSSGRVNLYLLTSAEVATVDADIIDGTISA
jgi:hypothetical protein